MLEHHDPRGEQGVVHEVRDVHDRDAALVQPVRDPLDRVASAVIEHGGRLIQKQDLGLHGERPGDRDALALPAREIGRVGLRELPHADGLERGVDAPRDLGLRHAEVLGSEGHVVRDDARDHLVVGVLKDRRHAPPDGGCALGRGRVDAEDRDRSRLRGEECPHELGERGLARAVGSEDADVLTLVDGERQPVERGRRARGPTRVGEGRRAQLDLRALFHGRGSGGARRAHRRRTG